MAELKHLLSENWIGTIVGFIGIAIGIIGIVLAYSFRSRPRLASLRNSLQLVGTNSVLPNEIEFLFKGKKVPKVTLSRVALWNIGNTTIKGDQIVLTDPLRIVISEGNRVLEAAILNRTREANDFACAVRPEKNNEVLCSFDYLDAHDGALIQLIHTGDDEIGVVGTLRGVPNRIVMMKTPRRQEPKENTFLSRRVAKMLAILTLLLGLPLIPLPLIGLSEPAIPTFGVLMVVLSVLVFWLGRRLPPSQLNTQITTIEPKKFWHRWTT